MKKFFMMLPLLLSICATPTYAKHGVFVGDTVVIRSFCTDADTMLDIFNVIKDKAKVIPTNNILEYCRTYPMTLTGNIGEVLTQGIDWEGDNMYVVGFTNNIDNSEIYAIVWNQNVVSHSVENTERDNI